jgi:hypothetical protein
MKKIFYTLLALFFTLGCSKNKDEEAIDGVFFKDIPSVFTLREAQEVIFTSATLQGSIKNNGTSQKEEFGFCYATSPSPTISNTKIQPSVVVIRFRDDNAVQYSLKDLQPNTRYYVRGYITTNGRTTYTNEISFQTLLPFRVTTSDLIAANARSISAKGAVIGIGNGSRVVAYGAVIGTTQNPTTQANLFIAQQTGQNLNRDFTFNNTFTNVLQPNTAYNLRAFAQDASGYVAYGDNLSFTTPQETRIIALSGDLNFGNVNINQTAQRTLTIRNTGNTDLIINNLTFSVTGFSGNFSGTIAPNTSQNVTITFVPTAAGSFSGTITVNANQTAGTNTINFSGVGIVPISLPSVQTVSFADVTQNAVTLNGNLTNLGNATNCIVAFVYSSTNQTPTLSSLQTPQQNFNNPNAFNAALTGLSSNTTYYFRAYATNTAGTVYGAVQSFRTGANVIQPTVATVSHVVTANMLTLNGRLTSLGSFNSGMVGFLFSTSQDPQFNNSTAINSTPSVLTSTANFSVQILNFLPNTMYFYRAFVQTPAGNVVLANIFSFRTLAPIFVAPQVETVSAIGRTNQIGIYDFVGNLTSLGSATLVTVGFEFSTDGTNFNAGGITAGTRTTTGNFQGSSSGFQNSENYWYRAYATYTENGQTKKVVGETKTIDDIRKGLVLYLPFSGNAQDASGNNNHGTVSNATLTPDKNGNPNNAYYFGSANRNIRVNKSSSLNFTNFSFSAWVRLADVNNDADKQHFIYDRSCNNSYSALQVSTGNRLFYTTWARFNSSSLHGANGEIPFNVNQWIFITTTYNATTREMKLYRNGTLVGQNTLTSGFSFTYSNAFDLYIGGRGGVGCTPSAFFNGAIDEFRMYNRALSASEVQLLYQQ